MAQLALLAGYAIILTATLLVDHRRIDTSMLRSRGAGPGQVALLALLEGLLLAVPAVLVAPWLAVGVLGLFNVVGPLADVGLQIDPRVSTRRLRRRGRGRASSASLLLVLPAALSARRFAAAQGDISRQETRTFGQRMGLDVALLALTIIALWQLRLYGAPLTRTVQGSLGLDPLLVAAPAIGLVAGRRAGAAHPAAARAGGRVGRVPRPQPRGVPGLAAARPATAPLHTGRAAR